MALMEVKMNKYVIKYKDDKSVTVEAKNLEDAIDKFKKLQIETATMEITLTTVYEDYIKNMKKGS
jgi:hypothetical protein